MSIPIWIIILFVGGCVFAKGLFHHQRGIGDLDGLWLMIIGAFVILSLGLFYAGMYAGCLYGSEVV